MDEPSPEWQAQLSQMGAKGIDLLMCEDSAPFFLNNPMAQRVIKDRLHEFKAEFVVFDALHRLDFKEDINTAEGVRHILDKILQVWLGPYLLLHHEHKPKEHAEKIGVNAAAGHHTLTANASMVLQLPGHDRLSRVKNRLTPNRTWKLARDPATGRWIKGPEEPAPTAANPLLNRPATPTPPA